MDLLWSWFSPLIGNNNKMNKFSNPIISTTDTSTYLAGLLFILIGQALCYKDNVTKRDKTSGNTPYQSS